MSKGGEYSYAVTLSVALILLVVTVTATILFSRYSRDIPLSARKPIHMAIAAVVCTISVVYLMVGIFNGGARDVFIKAVNICTECIGLG